MKRLLAAICLVTCLGSTARSDDYFEFQGMVMKCSPPKFMLVSGVDVNAQTLTGLLTMDVQKPAPAVGAFHRTFKLADVNVTNAQGKAIGEADFGKLKGILVVLSEGKTPLSAVYLSLFREDTVIITIGAPKE